MNLTPNYIKEHLEEIGIHEAIDALKEWVVHSEDSRDRMAALEQLGEIDKGNYFLFFEQLFISDEDINVRIFAGKILRDKYSVHKKIYPLL